MKIFFVLAFALLSVVRGFVLNEDCLVKTKNGLVKGYTSTLPRSGREYESYKCIRYAEPPVGKYRFWPPIPVKDWEGIYDARQTSCPVCVQKKRNGTEDCLYLSVFVPRFCGNKPLKVVFYIHGGGFVLGSGPIKPCYLLEECVIVVSINYRLGALGFLSLQTPGCSGNVGLKDQQLALKWVKENIHNFGGDPNDITLMGFSAGAASVTYHYLNQESCSLSNKGIAESGNALMPWAFVGPDQAKDRAHRFASLLGCSGTDEEMCECLKAVSTEDILDNMGNVLSVAEVLSLTLYAFVPTAEPEGAPQPFLQENPSDLVLKGQHCNGPLIIGVTKDEGCAFRETLQNYKTFLPLLALKIKSTAPQCIAQSSDSTCSKKVSHDMLERYTGNKGVNENNTVTIITEVQFYLETLNFARILSSQNVNVHLYAYTYNGECSTSKLTNPESTEVCHGDHLPYEFVTDDTATCFGNQTIETQDVINSKRLVGMWANFAENGTPTPEKPSRNLYTSDFNWPAWKEDSPLYCNIGTELTIRSCLGHDVASFWNGLSNICCAQEKELNQYPTCSQ